MAACSASCTASTTLRTTQFEIRRIDAAVQRRRTPQPDDVGPLVIVRAGNEAIVPAGQLGPNLLHHRILQPDQVDRHQGHLFVAVLEHHGPGHERIVSAGGLGDFAESRPATPAASATA